MSRYLLLSLFLINAVTLFGQLTQEVKFNLFGPFKGEYRPSYEILVHKNVGIEFEASFESLKRRQYGDYVSNIGRTFFIYQHRRFEVAVAGKYYFSKTKIDYGFFAGVYTGLNYIRKEDESFAANYEDLFNLAAPDFLYKKGFNHIFFGATSGYKFLIKEKVVAELSMRYVNLNYSNSDFKGLDIDMTFFVKLGYRF